MIFDLRQWQQRHGFTYPTAAKALGMGRATYARYLKDPEPPLWLLRACRDVDAERSGLQAPIQSYLNP